MKTYWKVLLSNIVLTAIVVAMIAAALGKPMASTGLLLNVLIQFGIVTVIFAIAKRSRTTAWNAVESYMKTMKPYLPRKQRDDIVNELLENIRSEVQEQELELGRPMNVAEVNAVLDRHGHPLMAAGRYRDDNRSLAFGRRLIAPELFPFYLTALALNLGITTALFVAAKLGGGSITVGQFLLPIVVQFGVVTLLFSLLEIFLPKFRRFY